MKETNVIGEVKKNSLEKIVISAKVFNNKPHIDARVWWRKAATDTDWMPSKRGFCVSSDAVGKLGQIFTNAAPIFEDQTR